MTTIPMPEIVRSILRPPEDLSVSHWCDRHRRLSDRWSRLSGPWRTAYTPYLREPLDATSDPNVQIMVFIKPSRVGGTEFINNTIAHTADADPVPIMYVQPTREDVADEMTGRLKGIFEDSPRLAELIPPGQKHWATTDHISLTTCDIYGAWPTNPQTMVRKTIGKALFDEIDNAEAQVGYLGNSLTLLEERLATYEERALLLANGTPTYAHAAGWRLLTQSDWRRYNVPCPHCGELQPLQLSRIRLILPRVAEVMARFKKLKPPKDPADIADWLEENALEPDPDQIEAHRLAGYECRRCRKILEHDKHHRWMIDRGVWIPRGLMAAERLPVRSKKLAARELVERKSLAVQPVGSEQWRPELVKDPDEPEAYRKLDEETVRVRGYHLNALYSPLRSRTWSHILAKHRRVKDQPDELRVMMNAWLAEPWQEAHHPLTEAELTHKRDDWDGAYDQHAIPDKAKVLLTAVDVQSDGVWYRARAFGSGGESWGIDEEFITPIGTGRHVQNDLEQAYKRAFLDGYRFADGRRMLARAQAVDSGYAVRLDEVKQYAMRPGVVLIKGMSQKQWGWRHEVAAPYRMSDQVRDLMLVNVDHYKSKVHRLIRLPEDHEQAFHFHRQTLDLVFTQICNEHETIRRHKSGKRKGRSYSAWEPRYDGAPTHLLDDEVYLLALADRLAVARIRPDALPIGVVNNDPRRKPQNSPPPSPGVGFGSSI
ncbi:MAG: terminase gpA endonuclease subunit [Planctomycetota bacterium]